MHLLYTRSSLTAWRKQQAGTVALVPTMGALHQGHLALVAEAKRQADAVIVSIFVNPRQFGPSEDYNVYPRQEEEDIRQLQAAGADAVYLPSVEKMYPQPFHTTLSVGPIGQELCGKTRPQLFDGAALVVSKLFMQVQPHIAIFGEKDYQQLFIFRQMVRELDIPVTIIGAITVRETDGLAYSSRNRYLNAEQRAIAPALYATLTKLAEQVAAGESDFLALCAWGKQQLLKKGMDRVDYIEIRDAATLQPLTAPVTGAFRVLGAAYLGSCRLIDNIGGECI